MYTKGKYFDYYCIIWQNKAQQGNEIQKHMETCLLDRMIPAKFK